ncbi:hypothetical protein LY76DRAFT_384651 [Colletotrichum caudatum]|nr:hypothetical protein LY76DRAFT_384651 [Colletotrichum caudatum]
MATFPPENFTLLRPFGKTGPFHVGSKGLHANRPAQARGEDEMIATRPRGAGIKALAPASGQRAYTRMTSLSTLPYRHSELSKDAVLQGVDGIPQSSRHPLIQKRQPLPPPPPPPPCLLPCQFAFV